MPVEMEDPDGDESPHRGGPRQGGNRFDGPRFGESRRHWWQLRSTVGRSFLGLAALMLLGGLVTCGYLLKSYLNRDARFRVAGASNIQATGLSEVSRAEMLPVFGEDIGRNIFFVPLNERRKQLEQLPWVERATVMRLLPDQIRVSVVERQPVAFTRQGQQIGLVDANGVLLTMPAAMMAQRHYSFPVVTGIDGGDPLEARKARMAVYQRLLAELDSNGQKLSEQISEIDLTDPEDARVAMPEQGADILAHFGQDRFLERYQRYKAHINEWRQQYPKLTAVDLRYEQQVVLEMGSGSSATQATGDEQNAADAEAQTPPVAAAAEKAPAKAAAKVSPVHAKADKPPVVEKGSASKLAGGKTTAAKQPVKLAIKPPAKAAAKPAKTPTKAAKTAAARGAKKSATLKVATAKEKAAKEKPEKAAKNKQAQGKLAQSKLAQGRLAQEKTAKEKKRAEAKRAVLVQNRRKPAPTSRPAVVTAEGQ
jgi:cell division protein FtsQ